MPLDLIATWPKGWWVLGTSMSIDAGCKVSVERFGQEWVLWRDTEGGVHLTGAYCPHMGAHLGYNGTIENVGIVCNLHRWHFDSSGRHIASEAGGDAPTKCRLGTLPTVEQDGYIYVWNGDGSPTWDVPRFPQLEGVDPHGQEWLPPLYRKDEVRADWFHLITGGADTVHAGPVHGLPTGRNEQWEVQDDEFMLTYSGTGWSVECRYIGPGIAVQHLVVGDVEAWQIGGSIPHGPGESSLCLAWMTTSIDYLPMLETFAQEVTNDIKVWENMAPARPPIYQPSDAALKQFHHWLYGFYA